MAKIDDIARGLVIVIFLVVLAILIFGPHYEDPGLRAINRCLQNVTVVAGHCPTPVPWWHFWGP